MTASVLTGVAIAGTAAPAAAADGPAWTCNAYGYLFQYADGSSSAYQVDLVTGEYTTAFALTDTVNAVAYNPTDNYMYAWDATTRSLVQIAADGTITQLPDPAGVDISGGFTVGDFDDAGHLWLALSSLGGQWLEVDYAAGSPTYGQVISSGTLPTDLQIGADWVFVDGAFYNINPDGHLTKFDAETHEVVDLGPLAAVPAGLYGAGYADASGYLYFSNNSTGEIYRVNPTTLESIDLASGPAAGGNDGARCASAPIPTVTVTKTIDGQRLAADDQFTVGLNTSAGDTLTSATTTGTNATATTTDWPVSQGATYTITDAMAAGSTNDVDDYQASVICTDTTTGDTVETGGTTGAWTLEVDTTDAYTCAVTNAAPSYSVQKTASASTANPGDTVEYTVTVKNTGNVAYTADKPASISDDLSSVLDDATYNDDAAVAYSGSSTSDAPSVTGNTLTWSGPLAVGETATITYSATVNDPATGDGRLGNTVTPTGPGGVCEPESDCATDTPVQSYTVAKSASVDVANPGDTVTYTVTVTNTGEAAYTADEPASFTDDLSKVLDDATYNDDATGGATVSGNTLSWSGPLAVGETQTITYSVKVNDPATGDHALSNTVVPDGPGGVCDPAASCTTTSNVQAYTVTKTADTDHVAPGETITYTVTVTNTGTVAYTDDDPASAKDDLTDVLDDATYNGDANHGATVDGNTLAWSGPLEVGQVVKITYSATVNDPDTGNKRLVNAVVPDGPGGSCDPEGACKTDTPVGSYTVTKTVSTTDTVKPGQKVGYTITVKNTGQSAFTAEQPASFKDDMSDVLDDATYNGDATGGATLKGTTLSWAGPLEVGQTITITYSVTVKDSDTGNNKLRNAVDPGVGGGTCDPEGSCVTNTPITPTPAAGGTTPDGTTPDGLAFTGTELVGPGIALALLLLALGGTGLYFSRRSRRAAEPDNA